LRVSLRLVCPFTLIVSYPISRLETSSGEMSLRPGCSCQATIITIKEEEHEDGDEDGDGAGREGGSVFENNVDSKQHLPLDRSPHNHRHQKGAYFRDIFVFRNWSSNLMATFR